MKGRIYLLSDVLYCATCGQALNGNYKRGARRYTHRRAKGDCPEKWITADQIETEILDILTQVLTGDLLALVRARAADLAQALHAEDPALAAALAEIERQEGRLARLSDLYIDGEIEKDQYLEKKQEIDVALATARQTLPPDEQTDLAQIVDQIEEKLKRLSDAGPNTKKAIINWMIARIEVSNSKIIQISPREFVRPFF